MPTFEPIGTLVGAGLEFATDRTHFPKFVASRSETDVKSQTRHNAMFAGIL
jgi:hypothetical protein